MTLSPRAWTTPVAHPLTTVRVWVTPLGDLRLQVTPLAAHEVPHWLGLLGQLPAVAGAWQEEPADRSTTFALTASSMAALLAQLRRSVLNGCRETHSGAGGTVTFIGQVRVPRAR